MLDSEMEHTRVTEIKFKSQIFQVKRGLIYEILVTELLALEGMIWVVIRNNYINYETNALINSKGIVKTKKKLKCIKT